MHSLLVSLLLAAGAPLLLEATDAPALVLRSEALIASLADDAALKPLYANEAQVAAALKLAMKGADARTLREVAKTIVHARKDAAAPPVGFTPTRAVVSMDAVNGVVRFLDDKGHALDFEWIRPGAKGKRVLLLSRPHGYASSLEQLMKFAAETPGAQVLVRDASGAWAPAPAAPTPAAPPAPPARK